MQTQRLRRMLFVVLGSTVGALACSGGGGGGGGPSGPEVQTGAVQGSVRDNENAAVASAAVSLTASGRQTRNTNTSASGSYLFSNIETGNWTVSVTPPAGFTIGTGAATAAISVAANQTTTAPTIVLAKQVTAAPLTATVRMYETNFSPQTTTIRLNGTVTWRNDDPVQHNVRAPGISSPDLGQNQTFQRQFTSVGTVQYSCGLHAGMTGTIHVVAP